MPLPHAFFMCTFWAVYFGGRGATAPTVRREYGMPSVPLTGFVPNVTEPRRQKRWDE